MKIAKIACIIDDDPIFVFGAQRLMRTADFCNGFLIFHDGQKALDYLIPVLKGDSHAAMPEVIFLDLNMPILDGWQFLDSLIKIEITFEITIFIVTSSIDPRDQARAKSYRDVKNFVIKPLSRSKLDELVLMMV